MASNVSGSHEESNQSEKSNKSKETLHTGENAPYGRNIQYGENVPYGRNIQYGENLLGNYGIPNYGSSLPQSPYVAYSSTDSSGSAIFPGYSSSVYEKIHISDQFAPEDETQKIEYQEKIRNFYLDELKNSSEAAQNDRKRLEKYGKWVFGISIGMTFLGVIFSIVQFYYAIGLGDFSSLSASLEIHSPESLIITTSAIGAFVLTLSLVFFFLFLNYVYKPNKKDTPLFPHIKGASDLM